MVTAEIVGVSRKEALEQLGISEPTLRDYQNALDYASPKGWEYIKHSKGFTIKELNLLLMFREIVKKRGRPAAIKAIKSTN